MKWVSLQRLTYALQKIEERYALITHAHSDASASVSGFLSAADKSKIDNFPSDGSVYGEEF